MKSLPKGAPGWELKTPKGWKVPQLMLSRLPDDYQGRMFRGCKVKAEFITAGSRYVQMMLPDGFFGEPEA